MLLYFLYISLYFLYISKIFVKYLTILYEYNNIKVYRFNIIGGFMADETKRERFVRIAEARTNKILDMMRLLGNCSSKSNYDYTEEDVRQIFNALEKELRNTKSLFLGEEAKEEKFKLKGGKR